MDLTQVYGPYYGGLLMQRGMNADRAAQNAQQGMQALGLLSQMRQQQEQQKLLAEQVAMAKIKTQKENALLDMFVGGGQPQGAQALAQGAAQGDIGPTNTNAERMGMLNQAAGVPGTRFSPQQYEALSYLNPQAARALVDVRKAFLPDYKVENGAIVGSAPGAVPQFQGFVPQVRMGNEGQAQVLAPDASGNLVSSIPAGAVENFARFKRATESARGADPIASGKLALETAEAADKGIAVPQPNTGAVQFPTSGQTQPGQMQRAQILQNEMASEQARLQQAQVRGDINGMQAAQRNIAELQRELGNQPAATAPTTAPSPGLNISPAQRRKLEEERPQATYAFRVNTANLDRLERAASELIGDKGLAGIAGLQGMFPNLPGGAAANAQAKFDTLKNQIALNTLQAMRDASKTGGAVGNVTEKEWPRLESALAALQKAQNVSQVKESLRDIQKIAQESKARLVESFTLAYPVQREQIIPPEGISANGGGNVIDFRKLR